jgi:hypothetical protein
MGSLPLPPETDEAVTAAVAAGLSTFTSGASIGVIGIENDDTEQLTLATFELQ